MDDGFGFCKKILKSTFLVYQAERLEVFLLNIKEERLYSPPFHD